MTPGSVSERLAPLLAPRSIAFVGASPKVGSFGHGMLRGALTSGYPGTIFPINPKYIEIEGVPCYPTLGDVPGPIDLAVLGVANGIVEGALDQAIAAGTKAAVIFSSGYLENDADPPLVERLRSKARAAGIAVCGGNSGGFINRDSRTFIALGIREPLPPGPVTLITHSGSVYLAMLRNNERVRWNLTVSSGQEIATGAADYLAYAVEQPTTKAVGLFIETVRDPAGFVAALEAAAERDIPVVVVKVGRTAESARFALSHSGAIAGDDAAYDAVFDRYGVHRVDDLDEFVATLQLLSQPRRAGPGGIAAILDSGGERELLVDQAAATGVPIAAIGEDTRAALAARLDYGLDPVNPLDAWGTGNDFDGIFRDCFAALVDDADTAVGLWVADVTDGYEVHEGYIPGILHAAARGAKPIAMATCFGKGANAVIGQRLLAEGIPLLEGIRPSLVAVRRLLDRRDRARRQAGRLPSGPTDHMLGSWRGRLEQGSPFDDREAFGLLNTYGIGVPALAVAETADEAVRAARDLGFPVALKTAKPGIAHKSDVDGVRLGLGDTSAVRAAYADLAERLGPKVTVSKMAAPGVEIALGMVTDPTWGPLVLVGAGGTLIEVVRDARLAIPPFDTAEAARLLDRLRCRPLLDGVRGRSAANVDLLADAIASFSRLVADLAPLIREFDVNPIIAGADSAIAVDALVIPAAMPQT